MVVIASSGIVALLQSYRLQRYIKSFSSDDVLDCFALMPLETCFLSCCADIAD